jgi:Ca2+-binding RTX toxin-like protein
MIKKFFNKKIRLMALGAVTLVLLYQTGIVQNFLSPKSALAVGELTVTWEGQGVGNVGPLFTMSNMAPGDSSTRKISVANASSSSRDVGIKGILSSAPSILSDALDIKISRSGTDLYGGTTGAKTLTQFLSDSTSPNGIFLATQNPGNSSNYLVTVKFREEADNTYQNKTISFSLKIGTTFDLPTACSNINFTNDPIIGTAKGEVLNGTPQNDIIVALEGNDTVDGKGGNDCIIGGPGTDRLTGGNGMDVLLGQGGSDLLFGVNEKDVLFGGEGTDTLDGGNDNDQLHGEDGADTANGGNGEDTITGGSGADTLRGDNGNDDIDGGPGNDSINGGLGRDKCIGESRTQCEL